MIGTIYLPPDEEQLNAVTMHQVETLLKELTIPYMFGGDFNMPPDELAHRWGMGNAMAITPSDATVTYTSGKHGTLIDYAIMSQKMHHFIKSAKLFKSTLIKGHTPIRYEMVKAPRKIWTRQLIKPRTLPDGDWRG